MRWPRDVRTADAAGVSAMRRTCAPQTKAALVRITRTNLLQLASRKGGRLRAEEPGSAESGTVSTTFPDARAVPNAVAALWLLPGRRERSARAWLKWNPSRRCLQCLRRQFAVAGLQWPELPTDPLGPSRRMGCSPWPKSISVRMPSQIRRGIF